MHIRTFPSILLSISVILTLIGCEENPNVNPAPVIEAPLVALNVDGDNLTAPVLPGNTYEAAVKFTPDQTDAVKDGKLIEVYYFIQDKPNSSTIRIYKKTDNGSPAVMVYSAATTTEIESNSWNKHTLTTPVDIDTDDLWISVRFNHNGTQQTMGCDPGPAAPNGDWFFDSNDGEWLPMRDRTNREVNINWNIRGVVDPR